MNSSKGKFLAKYKTTLLSTGIPSLDLLINGGLAVGTITLIEEDFGNVHCSLLCKHVISCGLTNGQETALVIDDTTPEAYLNDLPKILTNKPTNQVSDNSADLEIAWRYKTMRSMENNCTSTKMNDLTVDEFDMTKMSSVMVNSDRLSENMDLVLQFIGQFIKTKGGMRKPLRVVISSLGSPFWGDVIESENVSQQMSRFLFSLKRLINGTFTSVVITVNTELIDGVDEAKVSTVIRNFSDYAFKFDAFEDPKMVADKLYNEVTGQMRPIKIPSINSLEPIFRPNTLIWSYHVRRKKITFKEFSLPPCLSDNTSRSNQNNPSAQITTKVGCGIDF